MTLLHQASSSLAASDVESRRKLATTFIAVTAVLPLWLVTFVPGADLPAHLAIANVLSKLIAEDPVASHFYALNLQPVPYYGVYFVLAPLIAAFGPLLAAKLLLSALVVGTVASSHLLFKVIGSPWWATAFAVIPAYGMAFFWGFLPTYFGIPLVMTAFACIVRMERDERMADVWLTALVGLLLGVTHVALLAPWGCMVLGVLSTGRAKSFIRAAVIGMASSLPLLPLAMQRILDRSAVANSETHLTYDRLALFWDRVKSQFEITDHAIGPASHLGLLLCVVAFAVFTRRSPGTSPIVVRITMVVSALMIAMYPLLPSALDTLNAGIWALNLRLFFCVELGLVVLLTMGRQGNSLWGVPVLVCSALSIYSVATFFYRFDVAARRVRPVLDRLRDGDTLAIATKKERFGQGWAPVMSNMHAYHLAFHTGYDGALFAGAHIPIQATAAAPCSGNLPERPYSSCDYVLAQETAIPDVATRCTFVTGDESFALFNNCIVE